jgi:short-subunit dehydrogenase
MKRSLNHKKVLITGVAGGIGSQLAIEFGNGGCFVIGVDNDISTVIMLKIKLNKLGIKHDISISNLTDMYSMSKYTKLVIEKYGGIDILINNAGITHIEPIASCGIEKMRDVFEVNFWSAVNLTKQFLPILTLNKGTIIVINSVTGFSPLLERGAYTSSKHALHGFFETLRAECQNELDILAVYPDFIKTKLGADFKRKINKTAGSPKLLAEKVRRAWEKKRKRITPSFRAFLIAFLAKRYPNIYLKIMIYNMKK